MLDEKKNISSIDYQLKFIKYGSDEYYQAARLRYRLFYQECNILFESIFDSQEENDWHLAIITNVRNQVLAYGRLSQNFDEFQIYQMVVEPKYQGLGIGKLILQELIKTATLQGARFLILNARVTKVPFYEKFGFETMGKVFPSSSTGVPHIQMQKMIL